MDGVCIRDWQEGKLVSQDVACTIADVFTNEMVSTTGQIETDQEHSVYVCIHWDAKEGSSVSSIELDTDDRVSFSTKFCGSLDERASLLDTFIHSIYTELKSKLVQVTSNPISFVFINLQDDPFLTQRNQFITLLKSLLSKAVKPMPQIQVKHKKHKDWRPNCECNVHPDEKRRRIGNSLASTEGTFERLREQLREFDSQIETQWSSIELNVLEINEMLSHTLKSFCLTDDNKISYPFETKDKSEKSGDQTLQKTHIDKSIDTTIETPAIGNTSDIESKSTVVTQQTETTKVKTLSKTKPKDSDKMSSEGPEASPLQHDSSTRRTTDESPRSLPSQSHAISLFGRGPGKYKTLDDIKGGSVRSSLLGSSLGHRLGRGEDTSTSPEERRPLTTLADIKEAEWMRDKETKGESTDLMSLLGDHSLEDLLTGKFKFGDLIKRQSGADGFLEVIKISCEPEDAELVSSLTDAYQQTMSKDRGSVPKSEDGMGVILCLDTSASMSEEHLLCMKDMVNQFIDDVEEIATTRGLEENVGVMAFGKKSELLQPLTNDYGRIRDSLDALEPGGSSNLLKAIAVAFAGLRGAKCDYQGKTLAPRIIIFTDGLVTNHGDTDEALQPNDKAKTEFLRALKSLNITAVLGDSSVWVPVGNADRAFLKRVAVACKGEFVEGKDVKSLSSYQRIIKTSAHIITLIEGEISDKKNIHTIIGNAIDGLDPDLSVEGREDVTHHVLKYFSREKGKSKGSADDEDDESSPYRFDNVCQNPRMPKFGTRVRRGIDWQWRDQDKRGPGTIYNHNAKGKSDWVWVHWDHGHSNTYRYGADGSFDVLISDDPPLQPSGQTIDIGVCVERGPHWNESHGNEDGGPGSTGIVIRKRNQRVMVIWKNGALKQYSFGENDKYEVAICPPHPGYTLRATESQKTTDNKKQDDIPPGTPYVWQRMDVSGQWTTYSAKIDEMLKKDYQKNPNRATLISRDGQSYRISFTNLTERCLESSKTTKIRKHVDA